MQDVVFTDLMLSLIDVKNRIAQGLNPFVKALTFDSAFGDATRVTERASFQTGKNSLPYSSCSFFS
jgi:hypothetical protein